MFNDPRLCDAIVRILPENNTSVRAVPPASDLSNASQENDDEGASSTSSGSGGQGVAFLVVSAVLRAESEFFERAFTSWTEEVTTTKEVDVKLPREKFLACEILLRFMHDKQLPSLTFTSLFVLIELADQFLARNCLSEVCGKLAEFDFEDTSVSEALDVLLISGRPSLMLQPAMRLAKEKALFVFLEKFGDLEEIAQEKELLDSFLALPRPVVAELLGHEEVSSLSENTVFYLATLWLHHNHRDSPPSSEEYYRAAMEIGNAIRFPMMSFNYILHWVPQVRWIKDFHATSKFWLREATSHKLARECLDLRRKEKRFLPRTKGTTKNELVWKIPTAKIRNNADYVDESENKFFGGYLFQVGVSKEVNSMDRFLSTGFCVHPPWPSLNACNALLSKGECLQVRCSCKLKARKFNSTSDAKEMASNEMWDIGLWYEWPNFFGESADSVIRDHSQYVDSEGQLQFIMTIDDVE